MKAAAAKLLTAAASLFLAFMMLVVVADVIARAIDPAWRINGMLDYVELSLDWMVYLSIPASLLAGQVIAVDLIDSWDKKGYGKLLGGLATLIIFAILGSQVIRPALDVLEWREQTFDLGILKFYYWLAIWVGVGLSVIAAAWQLLDQWPKGIDKDGE